AAAQRDQQAGLRGTTQYAQRYADCDLQRGYVGPEWLARLVGNRAAVPVFQRFDHLRFRASSQRNPNTAWLPGVHGLRAAESAVGSIGYPVLREDLRSTTRLREIALERDRGDPRTGKYMASLLEFRRLEMLTVLCTPLVDELVALEALP